MIPTSPAAHPKQIPTADAVAARGRGWGTSRSSDAGAGRGGVGRAHIVTDELITHLGLLETRIDARLEVTEITEHALLELLHVAHGAAERFEAEDESADNVRAGDVVEAAPEDAGDVLGVGEQEAVEGGVGTVGVARGDGGRVRASETVVCVPSGGGGCEEELETVEVGEILALLQRQGPAKAAVRTGVICQSIRYGLLFLGVEFWAVVGLLVGIVWEGGVGGRSGGMGGLLFGLVLVGCGGCGLDLEGLGRGGEARLMVLVEEGVVVKGGRVTMGGIG